MWLLTEQQKRAKIIVPFHKLMRIEMQFLICNKTTLKEISVPLPPQYHTIVYFSRCFVLAPSLSFLNGITFPLFFHKCLGENQTRITQKLKELTDESLKALNNTTQLFLEYLALQMNRFESFRK